MRLGRKLKGGLIRMPVPAAGMRPPVDGDRVLIGADDRAPNPALLSGLAPKPYDGKCGAG